MSIYQTELDKINNQLEDFDRIIREKPQLANSYKPIIDNFTKRKKELETRIGSPVASNLGLTPNKAVDKEIATDLTEEQVNEPPEEAKTAKRAAAKPITGMEGPAPASANLRGIDGAKTTVSDKQNKDQSLLSTLRQRIETPQKEEEEDTSPTRLAEEKESLKGKLAGFERGEMADLFARKISQLLAANAGVDISKEMSDSAIDWKSRRKEAREDYDRSVRDIDELRKAKAEARREGNQEQERQIGNLLRLAGLEQDVERTKVERSRQAQIDAERQREKEDKTLLKAITTGRAAWVKNIEDTKASQRTTLSKLDNLYQNLDKLDDPAISATDKDKILTEFHKLTGQPYQKGESGVSAWFDRSFRGSTTPTEEAAKAYNLDRLKNQIKNTQDQYEATKEKQQAVRAGDYDEEIAARLQPRLKKEQVSPSKEQAATLVPDEKKQAPLVSEEEINKFVQLNPNVSRAQAKDILTQRKSKAGGM